MGCRGGKERCGGVEKCWGRCGKVLWGVVENEGRCEKVCWGGWGEVRKSVGLWGRCGKVCWDVGGGCGDVGKCWGRCVKVWWDVEEMWGCGKVLGEV